MEMDDGHSMRAVKGNLGHSSKEKARLEGGLDVLAQRARVRLSG
jgi:hypothetical protein